MITPATGNARASAAAGRSPSSVARVMICDDSAVIRGALARILEADPEIAVVAKVENGKAAVEQVRTAQIDVVVLDIEMPVMDGITFLQNLRKEFGPDKPPVVFCTTENDMGHIEAAILNGAQEYIMKPFDEDILTGKFAQVGLL